MLALGTTFDSSLIQSLARASADRCTGKGGDFDAIAAVILTYSAFEAFLNEVTQLAQTLLREQALKLDDAEPSSTSNALLDRVALAMRVAQDRWASVEYRYDLAWEILDGAEIKRGEGARQSLSVLTKLRNDLVHAKSQETSLEMRNDPEDAAKFDGIWLGRVVELHKHPSYFRFLKATGVLAPGNEEQRWLFRICSRKTAEWACQTVEQLAAELVAAAPDGSRFKQRLGDQSLGGTLVRRNQR
jgi:hypothetical protein